MLFPLINNKNKNVENLNSTCHQSAKEKSKIQINEYIIN
jgi:hypothetical protein